MGIFSSPAKKKLIQPESFPGAPKLRQDIGEAAGPGALERLERAGEAFPGQLTAERSGFEETGLAHVGEYLDTPYASSDPLYQSARQEYEQTLGDGRDPFESEYYQAFRDNTLRELAEAKDRLASRTSARDSFYTGGRIAGEGELEETALGGLRQTLGEMQERERLTRLGIAPDALRLAMAQNLEPAMRAEQALTFGERERSFRQTELDREREEWIRQLTDLGIPLQTAFNIATWQPSVMMDETPKKQKAWVEDTAGIGQLVMALFGGGGGGGGTGKTGSFNPSQRSGPGGTGPLAQPSL